jgi:hypothetical protein
VGGLKLTIKGTVKHRAPDGKESTYDVDLEAELPLPAARITATYGPPQQKGK